MADVITNVPLVRPTTRGELAKRLKAGEACEVVADNEEITSLMLSAWLECENFSVTPSSNPGWVVYNLNKPAVDKNQLTVGHRYFFRQSRRSDQFAHKRYTNPECEKWQSIIVMGRVVKQVGQEVKVIIEETGMQNPDPQDGTQLVFNIGSALCATGGDFRTLEQHGKPDAKLGVWLEG